MFTGLIEQCGVLRAKTAHASGVRFVFDATFDNLTLGESIAVNGVCLTLVEASSQHIQFDVSPETLKLTSFGALEVTDKVHLERALRAADRLGGHYVSGHVDTTAEIQSIREEGEYLELVIGGFLPEHMRYLCLKGSVALDGVSLTINAVSEDTITVMLVPHTLLKTTLGCWEVGQRVNVEFDYIARIVVHQLGSLSDSTIMSLFSKAQNTKEAFV